MLFLMCEYPFFRGQDWSIVKSLQRKPSAMAIACSIGVSHPILTSCLWKLVFIKTAKKSKESRRNISGWYQIIPCSRINIHDVSAKKKLIFIIYIYFSWKTAKSSWLAWQHILNYLVLHASQRFIMSKWRINDLIKV